MRRSPFIAYLAGVAIALILLGSAGCTEDRTSPPTSPGALYDLRIASGDNQSGRPGEELPQPLAVEAVDREGRPVARVRVRCSPLPERRRPMQLRRAP